MKQNRLNPEGGHALNEVAGMVSGPADASRPTNWPSAEAQPVAGLPAAGWKKGIAGMAAAGLVTLSALGVASIVNTEPAEIPAPAVPSDPLTQEELLRDLVNRGFVPEQALIEPISPDELMRDLVNRGLIPAQALD